MRGIRARCANRGEPFERGGKSTAIDGCCTGAAVRQPLRPLHVLQSEIAVDRVHVYVSDRDRKCDGERRWRPSSGGDDSLRRRRRASAARLVELHSLAVHDDRFVHEVRGCAELIRYDTRDTLVVEQQQSPDR